jgi:N-acetylglucosaminyldiphosphoundecaprenol N-acetyl-beta-D-mannosaminyltransferase
MVEAKYISTLGFKVFSDNLNLIPIKNGTAKVINTISPNSYGITTKDELFKKSLEESDYLVLDGVYFAFSSILLKGQNIKRNQGPDVFYHFMNRINETGGRVFFLGSKNEALEKIKNRAAVEYPNIKTSYFSPPFKDFFTEEEDQNMIEIINNFKPDILFIGMTCPKQEKWANKNKKLLNSSLIISIGNVFDWFAGTQKVIHPFWFKIRLGWLIRIYYRPEVFRRNINNQLKFFRDVILIFLKIKKYD